MKREGGGEREVGGGGCKERKGVGLLSGTDRGKNKPRFEREREGGRT